MEFLILGRLEVIERGQQVALGGAKQRALLAVLLLRRGTAVSVDGLVEQLWGDSPPPTAAKTIQVYVSRLRKVLGDGVVETRGRGYMVAVDSAQIDAGLFEALAAEGRAALESGEADRALAVLSAALELWRSSPLEEFRYEPFAEREIVRLEEARLAALEDRIDAELRVGHGAELVLELERLVAEHPLRERLVAALMLALYRGGRQSDALAACRTARDRLVEELGLEPGPELYELQQRILHHDPTLMPPRAVVRAPLRRAGRRRASVAAALAIVAVLTAGFLFSSGAARSQRATLDGANGLVAVNTGSGKLVAATRFTEATGAVGVGAGSVWVADPGAGSISRIDPSSGAAVDRVLVGGEPGSIVLGGGALWVASTVGATVVRVDPGTGSITQRIAVPGANLDAMAYGQGHLWISDAVDHKLFEIDSASGSLQRTWAVNLQPSAVALAAGAVWIAGYDTATVEKIDPTSGRTVGRVHVGSGPVALAFQRGALWVANNLDATVSKVDPTGLKVLATIPVRSGPSALATNAGSVWVANKHSDRVSRIDARTNRVVATAGVGGAPTSLAIEAGRLWVGVDAEATTHRGGTLVLASAQRFASVDPAFYNVAQTPQFVGLAYDTLITFQHSGASDGLRLVPDLALAIPAAARGGTTYGFRLRRGIRYSTGAPLRAGDFRRAIERLFRVGSPGASFFAGLVGAGSCEQQPRSCHLARGIVTNDRAATVTFHLTRPDPQFMYKLTEQGFSAPMPPGTPDPPAPPGRPTRARGSLAPPGTGPYRIAEVNNARVRFVRNPFFREWSQAAQPDGNPDAIVWKFARSLQGAAAAVRQGRADWLFGLIPASQYRDLQLRHPAQLHTSPQFGVDFVPINTHRAPFNDTRVRQALNYAIDRGRIARMYGGPTFATPTCQPLAPGLPGYRRYCPYTLHRRGDGAWSAPDLAMARRLVRESNTRGERIDLWGTTDESYMPPGVPAYVGAVLRSLGYRVDLHLTRLASIKEAARKRFQLSVDGDWIAEYPDPSAYIPQFFGCGGGTSNDYYCNPRLDREMRKASELKPSSPASSMALWTSVDHQLTDDAPWVPTVNQQEVDLVSSRLHNYQYNPVWGFLADQSWLG